jgi:H+-transporting ATPase
VELVETAEQRSHFQRAVLRIGYFLISVTAVLVLTIVLYTLLARDDPWTEVLLFALGLTLAGIPQALPAVLSVTMSVGASRLARKKAIVSRLAAMEEMAGLEVLCADKTGTLTRNRLELQDPVVVEAEDEHELIVAAALASRRDSDDDPIDSAILEALEDESELDGYEVVEFNDFDPTRKHADAEVKEDGRTFRVAKGAPQVILDLTDAGEERRQEVSDRIEELGEGGYRSLGVARAEGDGGWRYMGILPLLDPPREDAAEVVAQAERHGIDIRILTGDHEAIACQVAGQLGMGRRIAAADEVFGKSEQRGGGKAEEEQRRLVMEADGFAEVTPEHKFDIVERFQQGDRIVGMTGDGVNDAPALEQADVGIAVAGATDATRAAADLILTEEGLRVVTHAVQEARRIFERMTGYATFRITESTRVLLFVSISILAFGFYPVTPIMIVLLAILNDIPIMTIAWDNVPTAGNPVRWNMKRVLSVAAVLGVTGVMSSFILFWFLRTRMELPEAQVQTMLFLKLLVAGHMTIFLTRNQGWMWDRPWPALSLFLALEGTQIAGTLVAVYGILVEPIGWAHAGAVWAYALVWILVLNAVKVGMLRLLGAREKGLAGSRGSREKGRAS